MKLKNKEENTLEELEGAYIADGKIFIMTIDEDGVRNLQSFDTLAKLHKTFEDYEGEWPQVGDTYYAIHNNGTIHEHHWEQNQENQGRPVFNIFKTREEARLALDKFDAWKRLEDKGLKFKGISGYDEIHFWFPNPDDMFENNKTRKDLDLLFSGGEE